MGAGEAGGDGGIDAVGGVARLTGLELYDPASTPVLDSAACGTLLLWSRSLSGVIDEPLLGFVEGFLRGLDSGAIMRGRSQLTLEPGGLTSFVGGTGDSPSRPSPERTK